MAEATEGTDQLVKAYVKMWNEREYSKISDIVSESFVMYDPGAPGGEVHGPDGLEEFMRGLVTGFPDFQVTIIDMLSSENLVMYEANLAGTHDGEFAGAPPTGREFDLRAMEKFHITDGNVREHRVYFDQQELFEQLGLTET